MSRLSGSPYVLDYHDLDHPGRPVFVTSTSEGDRFDTATLRQVAAGGEIEWLWPGMIPLRRVTLIEGPSGAGKSQLVLDLAARASRSAAWPNSEPSSLPEADVLVVCRRDEDEVVSARFERAGGDPKRLFQFREFQTYLPDANRRGNRPIAFPYDFMALEQLVEENAFGVIIIDSLAEFCATPKLFAEALEQLEDLASRANAALLVTVPANCRVDGSGRLRATSRWPTESVRSAWCLVQDPEDPWRRMFVAKRTNYCREPDGLAFRLADSGLAWEATSRISPVDPLGELSASELFVQQVLNAGDLPASTVFRLGAELGFTPKVLRAASKRLKVTTTRVGYSGDGHWSWSLPGARLEADVVCVEPPEPAESHRALEADPEVEVGAFEWAAPRNLLMERELLAQETARSGGRTEVPDADETGQPALPVTPAGGAGLATAPAAAEPGPSDTVEPRAWERDHAEARRLRRKARRQRKIEWRQARTHAG